MIMMIAMKTKDVFGMPVLVFVIFVVSITDSNVPSFVPQIVSLTFCEKTSKVFADLTMPRRRKSRLEPSGKGQLGRSPSPSDEEEGRSGGSGAPGAVDAPAEPAGPSQASPAGAAGRRQESVGSMDDSGLGDEPPRKRWREEEPGEWESFVHFYQRSTVADPNTSIYHRHRVDQLEMHAQGTLRAGERRAGYDHRSGTRPDIGDEWKGAAARHGVEIVDVMELTRSRKRTISRESQGKEPRQRRPIVIRERKRAEAARKLAPLEKKASKGAPGKSAAPARSAAFPGALAQGPPRAPPARPPFRGWRLAGPGNSNYPRPQAPLPNLRMTLRQPTLPSGWPAMLAPRVALQQPSSRWPAPPQGYRYGLIPTAAPPSRPSTPTHPQPRRPVPPLMDPAQKASRLPHQSTPIQKMQPSRQTSRQAHQPRHPHQAPRQPTPGPSNAPGGRQPRRQCRTPTAVTAQRMTTTTTDTTSDQRCPTNRLNRTIGCDVPIDSRVPHAMMKYALAKGNGPLSHGESAPPKEQRPPKRSRPSRDWKQRRAEREEEIRRDYADAFVASENYSSIEWTEPLRPDEAEDPAAAWKEKEMRMAAAAAGAPKPRPPHQELAKLPTTAPSSRVIEAAPAYEEGEEEEEEEEEDDDDQTWPDPLFYNIDEEELVDELEVRVDDSEERWLNDDGLKGPAEVDNHYGLTEYEEEEEGEEEEGERGGGQSNFHCDDEWTSDEEEQRLDRTSRPRSRRYVTEEFERYRSPSPNRDRRGHDHLSKALEACPGAENKKRRQKLRRKLGEGDLRFKVEAIRGRKRGGGRGGAAAARGVGSSKGKGKGKGKGNKG